MPTVKEIKVQTNNVYFQGAVDEDTTLDLITKMNDIKTKYKKVNLWINTDGGDGCAGIRTLDVLVGIQNDTFEITTIAFGEVMSAGVYLLLAGKKRYMTKNSFVLIHQSSLSDLPDMSHSDLKKYVDYLDRCKQIDFNIFTSEYCNIPIDNMKILMSSDNNYLGSDRCIEWGIVDGLWPGAK
jgi:ATP-dependent protease ClpP protease subunit